MSDDGTGWMVITLEDKIARRQGVPAVIPVPKAELETIAEKGLGLDRVKAWVTAFLKAAPPSWRAQNAPLAKRYDAFLSKLDMWKKGQAAFEKRDYPAAIASFKLIGNVDKEDHAAKLNLAASLSNTGDFTTALGHLESIRATFEGEADYHVAIGQVHLAMKETEKATEEMVLALEAKPDCLPALEALKGLGFLVTIYEDPKDAASLVFVRSDAVIEYLTGVWDAQPRETAFFLEQMAYHQAEGRHAVVLAAAEKASSASPGLEALEAGRVSALRALGRTDESLAAAQAYLAKNPASARLEVELAQSLATAGKKDESAAATKRALAIDPGDLMGLTLQFGAEDPNDLEQVARTLPALKAYAAEHPTSAGALRVLARAKLATDATDEALDLLAKAVALTPTDEDLRTEYWGELRKAGKHEAVIADAETLADKTGCHWGLRWSEAESYAALGKKMEARTLYTQLNNDPKLHVDIRRRAKRAAMGLIG